MRGFERSNVGGRRTISQLLTATAAGVALAAPSGSAQTAQAAQVAPVSAAQVAPAAAEVAARENHLRACE